jgi:hypothetical protein
MSMVKALWAYRGFVLGSVKREFQSKYRNSLLGAAWTVINPLAMIVVYTVIFSQVMKAKLPGMDSSFGYSIYLCAGSLTWGLFAEIVSRGQNIFIDNANLLKKISFPRMTLPIIAVLNALVNFAIIFGLFLAFLVAAGFWLGVLGCAGGVGRAVALGHRSGHGAGRAECVFQRCGPVLWHLLAVLVLVHACGVPGQHLARAGQTPHGTQPNVPRHRELPNHLREPAMA